MKRQALTLVAICALSLAAGVSVLSGADPAAPSKADLEEQLQQLQQKRLESAQRVMDALQAAFNAQSVTVLDFREPAKELLQARLAVATTTAQEIDELEKYLALMRKVEDAIKVKYELTIGGGEAKHYFAAKRDRQTAEIALIKARLKALR